MNYQTGEGEGKFRITALQRTPENEVQDPARNARGMYAQPTNWKEVRFMPELVKCTVRGS